MSIEEKRRAHEMSQATEEHPFLNSIQADSKLREVFLTVKDSKHYDQIKNTKLGEYWDESLISAPFVEEMTIGELVGMKIEHLLQKKSFHNMKIHGVIRALESALDGAVGREDTDEKPKKSFFARIKRIFFKS